MDTGVRLQYVLIQLLLNFLAHFPALKGHKQASEIIKFCVEGGGHLTNDCPHYHLSGRFNPSNTKLNPICPLLALFGAHHILHVSK
jgi:hypothetical protein